jgi:hypothetical protein
MEEFNKVTVLDTLVLWVRGNGEVFLLQPADSIR